MLCSPQELLRALESTWAFSFNGIQRNSTGFNELWSRPGGFGAQVLCRSQPSRALKGSGTATSEGTLATELKKGGYRALGRSIRRRAGAGV